MMREVIGRYFHRIREEELEPPDLIVVDGRHMQVMVTEENRMVTCRSLNKLKYVTNISARHYPFLNAALRFQGGEIVGVHPKSEA